MFVLGCHTLRGSSEGNTTELHTMSGFFFDSFSRPCKSLEVLKAICYVYNLYSPLVKI